MSLELNSCVLIDYRLWAAKSEGRQWVEHCIEQCIEQCLKHHPEPRSGLCPELLADFRIPNLPGAPRGRGGEVSGPLCLTILCGRGWSVSFGPTVRPMCCSVPRRGSYSVAPAGAGFCGPACRDAVRTERALGTRSRAAERPFRLPYDARFFCRPSTVRRKRY